MKPQKLPHFRQFSPYWIGALLAALLLGGALWGGTARATLLARTDDPVTAAWEKARAAGSYHFSSDVTQLTVPVAKVSNVGRSSRTEKLRLEGQTDLRAKSLQMQLWSNGGSVLQAEGGVAIKVENGKTFARQGANDVWREAPAIAEAMAPQGDFLAYLHAMRAVQTHEPETRGPSGRGIKFTRYSFTIDGPAFALYVRDQMEATMRAKGELPNGVNLNVPAYYSEMSGDGELWVGENGLPLRQILNLNFPEQREQTTHAQIVVNFSRFGTPQPSIVAALGSADLSSLSTALINQTPDLTPLVLFLASLVFVALVVHYRRSRKVYLGLVSAIILSMVVGPLLNTLQLDAFFAAQEAKAAAEKEQQASNEIAQEAVDLGRPEFKPNINPLENGRQGDWESGTQSPTLSIAQSPNLQSLPTDSGQDSDGDGLSNFAEQRVGSDENVSDSDDDGVGDGLEVRGFTLGGQSWYLNPRHIDSNNDGIGDGQEWGNNLDGTLFSTPQDSDGDNLPDLFDPDNDNDGVPDRQDMAPFSASASATPFSEATPFQLTINGLTANTPTFVDFQIRPTDPSHLWYAFNVVDWPRNDDKGQVQDMDGGTYADLAVAQGRTPGLNESFGDLKLVPMLEIRLPITSANLPPQSQLTPYNIAVNNLSADGSQKVAYIPLSIVSDEQTGQRVAFTARMNYLPSGTWSEPHKIRMTWVAQMLTDIPCDHTNPDDVANGCAADDYFHNVPQVIQSYYDSFTLTGLTVSEQHGAKTALIYEDPTVDPDLEKNTSLTALTLGLDQSFLGGRGSNGVLDVDIAKLADRFDRNRNGNVPSDQRWGLDSATTNVLNVETHSYATLDQATISTAMTETLRLLTSQFDAEWNNNQTLKPTILYAYEHRARSLGLDATRDIGGYVDLGPFNITLNMNPFGQPRVSLDTAVGVKWTHYCRDNNGTPWGVCASDAYWEELERLYGALPLSDEPNDPNLIRGSNVVMQLHNLALTQGINAVVMSDQQLLSGFYTLQTDSEIASAVRSGLNFGAAAVKKLTNLIAMNHYLESGTIKRQLGANVNTFLQQSGTRDRIRYARTNPRTAGVLGASIGVGIGLLALDTYFLASLAKNSNEVLATRIILRTLVVGIQTYSALVDPLITLSRWNSSTTLNLGSARSILHSSSEKIGTSRTASLVGAAISVAIVWGFFIYSMVANKVSAFSPEFNKALAETIAATIYIIMLTVLSATVIGLLLVGIVAVIDAILTSVCELGVDDLRTVPGLGGACFSVGTAATKVIAYFLYNYDLMIDTNRTDMVAPGAPRTQLANPSKGFVTGNDFTITMPVVSKVVHKDPDPASGLYINFYLYYFSPDNVRSSTFNYSLTHPNSEELSATRGDMRNAWVVDEDHKYVRTPMYRGFAAKEPTSAPFTLPPGINQPAEFYLNMGYALPAYECWVVPVTLFLTLYPVPICYVRTFQGENSTKIDTLRYDIFPNSIGGFMALTGKPTGGQGFAWDAGFSGLPDADGDGLLSSHFGGLDPNDAQADGDNDGLADLFEIDRRAAGLPYSPIQCDTDNDGLTDGQELQAGSNPSIRDSDNDGLSDAEEVWHQVYNTTTCQPTNSWSGGWNVTINAVTPFSVRVSSNPSSSDVDGDGISDLAEKQLALSNDPAQRVDKENRPYHPNVFNISPITVLVDVDDQDRFVAVGQQLRYKTTAIASAPTSPSMLDISAAAEVGGARLPARLAFDPNSFNNEQSVVNQTDFTVLSGSNRQQLNFASTVRARLAPTGPADLSWDTIALQTLGSTPPQPVRFMSINPFQRDRQDSYMVGTMSSNSATFGGTGQVINTLIPGGTSTVQAPNALNNATATMSDSAPDIACNNAGRCLMVWEGTVSGGTRVTFASFFHANGQQYGSLILGIGLSGTPFQPVVASNGSDFAVVVHTETHIRALGITGGVPASATPLWTTEFTISSAETSSSVSKDLAWIGDRYRLAFKFRRLNSPNHDLYLEDFNATNGGQMLGFPTLIVPNPPQSGTTDSAAANASAESAPVLAYNPRQDRILLLYQRPTGEVRRVIFSGSNLSVWSDDYLGVEPGTSNQISGDNFGATYDYRLNKWLVTVDGRAMFLNGFFGFVDSPSIEAVALNSKVPVACPVVNSLPLEELPFEEFPVATGFGNATCAANQCPAAGLPGATDNLGNAVGTPASDYSVQFDGIDDQLSLNNPLGSEFSLAFWYKATGGASSTPFSVQSNQPAGFGLFIYNTSPNATEFFVGNTTTGRIATSNGLADGQWHYLVATRAITGGLSLYLDGNPTPVASNSSSPTPAMGSTINIGGSNRAVGLDNLQLYNVALSPEMIQSLYQRTNQSYCVGVNDYRWAKLNLSQPDTRGGKVVSSGTLTLTIDSDKPTSSISGLVNGQWVQGNRVHTIGGIASDPTSSVAKVEVKPGVNANWEAATGAASWAYNLAVTHGSYVVQTRATDAVGNVETPNSSFVINADAVGPFVSLDAIPNVQKLTARNSAGQWLVNLSGTASDAHSGIPGVGVVVFLDGQGAALGNGGRTTNYNNGNWTVSYDLPQGVTDPTGIYTVTVRGIDNVDNLSENDAIGILRIDNAGPAAALNADVATRAVFSTGMSISGVISDTGVAGVDQLEVAFVSVEAIAALPNNISAEEADAQLNRTWLPATVAQRGASTSGWTLLIPNGLEGEYQIDLRGIDMLGNVLRSANAWRGVIDTLAPRVVMAPTYRGITFLNPGNNRLYYLVELTCGATDRYLDEATFNCPSNAVQPPVRSFDPNSVLQVLFPDRTILNGLSNSTVGWESSPVLSATASACDMVGNCTSVNSGSVSSAAVNSKTVGQSSSRAVSSLQSPVSNLQSLVSLSPQAVIVAPSDGSYVLGNSAISVTVAAEAAAGLKEVTIRLDNQVVQTLTFAQSENVTNTLRTINVTGLSQGQHTVTAQATDWANAIQTTDYPMSFTLDTEPPTVTIDPATLTNADSWAPGSGVLRFNGTASDSIGLVAVQIGEGNNNFVDVEFANGTWQTALPIVDPEGRTLQITVRAIDRAGRISEVTQNIGTDLSSATAPNTTIESGPANPSNVNSASFVLSGTVSAVAYECQLDDNAFVPCVSPQEYSELSKGSHTFRVRAIDGEGNVDLSPAEYSWTVNASALDATITSSPANPSSSRDASFTFTGTGNAFDCALDGAGFTPCSSPQSYSGLSYGDHTFQVRARNGSEVGAADRFTWNIVNAAPVANSQTLTISENSAIALTLTATDTSSTSADSLTYKVGNPAHGVLLGVPPALTYSPDSGFFGTDSFTFVANDGLNDSNVATVTINIQALDRSAPTSTITLAPPAPNGQNGWYTQTVQVSVSASDGSDPKASGVAETRCLLDPATPPLAFGELPADCAYTGAGAEVAADGPHTVYAASRDVRGNAEIPVNKGFQIDRTLPTISASGAPAPNGAGWNNSDVTVTFTCADSGSGLASCTAPQVVSTDDANQVITGTAKDNAGNAAAATFLVKLDKTAPTVTCSVTPNNLWPPNHRLVNIQATVTVVDALSGPAGFTLLSVTSNEPDSGTSLEDLPVDIQGWATGTADVAGQVRAERVDTGTGRLYTLTYEGKDVAGNTALCTTTVRAPKSQGGVVATAAYDENAPREDSLVDGPTQLGLPSDVPVETVAEPTPVVPEVNEVVGPTTTNLRLFLPVVANEQE